MVSDDKIKKAFFDMAPFKAPRINGFHAFFFQNQWNMVGNVVYDWVKKVFLGNHIDPALNNTLITLIPKLTNLKSFQHFRPINLFTVLYKLVMKVIANWFWLVFLKIMAEKQAS